MALAQASCTYSDLEGTGKLLSQVELFSASELASEAWGTQAGTGTVSGCLLVKRGTRPAVRCGFQVQV